MKQGVTLVITSCNRPLLLKKTLCTFFQYNTYPITKVVIIDDSGISGCVDTPLEYIPKHINTVVLYNKYNIGQIKSIDLAYKYVDTEYIFHCEDDWEFYNSGFIETSMSILEQNLNIFTVWLREYKHNRVLQCGHPIIPHTYNNLYKLLGWFTERNNIWYGFTFNPGLRRYIDYKLYKPYSQYINLKECYDGGVEQYLSRLYFKNGYSVAITNLNEGFVRHIGWDNPTKR